MNGTKFLIGNEVGADLCVVAAKSDPDAVQAHGGWDVVDRPKVERLFRDSRHTRIREGTSEIQRLVISRGVLEPAVK
ncbi:MAG: acyl-CoA dehydrogenase family protein [Sulfuricaulis sp.]|nr:acyl-CoA dehydrogenase family protein [Sulfuricaulis sp.]